MTIWFDPTEISNDLDTLLTAANIRVDQANYELLSALETRKRIQYLIARKELDKKGIYQSHFMRGRFVDVVVNFEEGPAKCRLEGIEFYRNEIEILIRRYTKKGKPMAEVVPYDLNIIKHIQKFTESK